ncbi:hypothetical protein KOW79_010122 [Hemibagrus wyckioides]|uniref:LIM zinc-binding domain-containing protein n=1 Tax=Hemibagrus wyckioides TaxID=337641 RepID=A0A9D3SJE3_9TELE|nr:sciellin isoform X2 [Hemibagrus wyckioides]KAG7326721.1 hypothetical protein KOW79_010122 [Hemibagrus wyckioides]
MYSNKTQQLLKSGISPSQGSGGSQMRRKALLQDNSWIKKYREDEPEDEDPNYGRDVLGSLKTWNSTESKPAGAKQSTANLNTSVSSFTKRSSESQDFLNKKNTPTGTKPPVPDKKTSLTTQSNSFTALVFSGANSSEKLINPVKNSMDEKDELLPAYKEVPDGKTAGPTVEFLNSHVSQTLHSPINPTPVPSTASRIISKRDLCTFCAKSIIEGERIILDDFQIFSHTFCFKCDMCYHALGNLEAGDSLWVHRGRVICANCYIKTKDQWYR